MSKKLIQINVIKRLGTVFLFLLASYCSEAGKVLDAASGEDTPNQEAGSSLFGTWDGYLTTPAQTGSTTLTQSQNVSLILLGDQSFVLNIIENGISKKMSGTFTLFPDDQLLFSVGSSELPTLMPAGSSFLTKIFRQENRATISNDYLTFTLTQSSSIDTSTSSDQVETGGAAPLYTGLWRCQDEDFRTWKIEINKSGGLIAFAIFNNIERPLWLKGNIAEPKDPASTIFDLKIAENNAGLSPLTGSFTLVNATQADVRLEGSISSGGAFLSELRCDLN